MLALLARVISNSDLEESEKQMRFTALLKKKQVAFSFIFCATPDRTTSSSLWAATSLLWVPWEELFFYLNFIQSSRPSLLLRLCISQGKEMWGEDARPSKSLQAPWSTHTTVNKCLFMRCKNRMNFPLVFLTIFQWLFILEMRNLCPLCSQY